MATPAVRLGRPEQDQTSYRKIRFSDLTVYKSEDLEPDQGDEVITIDICKFFCFQNLKISGARPKPGVEDTVSPTG